MIAFTYCPCFVHQLDDQKFHYRVSVCYDLEVGYLGDPMHKIGAIINQTSYIQISEFSPLPLKALELVYAIANPLLCLHYLFP